MESTATISLLLTTILTTTTAVAATTSTSTTNQQMENMINALLGAGDFSNWASILSSADPSILPITATLFIPSDADYDAISAASAAHLSPFLLLPYHVLPTRLSYADLRLFLTNTRLPTILPGFSLIITNNSLVNFSIDGVQISHPDLYQNAAVFAHGISAPFDYTVYGAFDYRAVFGNSTGGGVHQSGDFVGPVSGSAPLWTPPGLIVTQLLCHFLGLLDFALGSGQWVFFSLEQ